MPRVRVLTIVETILFVGLGVVGVVEGLRLMNQPAGLYEMMSPGMYVFGLSIALAAAGIIHLFVNRGQEAVALLQAMGRAEFLRVVSLIALLGANIFLIRYFGYEVATFIFFAVLFWIFGVRSLIVNPLLSLAPTVVYYLVFVEFCKVIFPSGIFFG
jgi:hypothetical protein